MPRSSRSKSHKQSKHSSKEAATAREYSGSDEDVKTRERSSNGGKEDGVSVRASKDSSVSGERRKHGKDLSISHGNHGNGDVSVEYTTCSKRREEKRHGGSDRWNGGSSDEKGLVVNIENKESLKSKDFSKGLVVNIENKESLKSKDFSKVSSESKSKSSRKHDVDSVNVVVLENDENKSINSNRGEKRKAEENKESKDKDRSSSKQVENQSSRRGKEITEWPIEEELRNPELEKELEKRMRRRGEGSSDKDKYQEYEDRRVSTRSDRYKDEKHKNEEFLETRQKDEKHREDGDRDRKNRDSKHRGETERYSKHRDDKDNRYKDEKYIEIVDKEEKNRDGKRKQDDKYRDVKHREDPDREKRTRDSKYASKDQIFEPETKWLRDDSVGSDLYYKDDRYKDDKDRRRGNDKDKDKDESEYRSRKDQRSGSDKRSTGKVDSVSRYADVEMPAGHSRRRSSPGSYPTRDHHRASNRDYTYEDRSRHRDYISAPGQPDKKVNPKDDSYTRTEVDKSSSRSLDIEETGPRSGGSKDNVKETQPDNDFSQIDNDNLSVSSPYPRNSHFSGNNNNNSKSLLAPPSDGPFFGSTEDDRNKSNNRHRRMVDQNMGRSQNNWKNVPNWPPQMGQMTGGGYIPFQHVPPPMFHPLMQQFPPPIFGRPPMNLNLNLNPGLPYHVPDHGRPLMWRNDETGPPPLHGFGDESQLYGRPDWDRRAHMNNRGWESGQQKDGYSGHGPSDEVWSGQTPDENEPNLPDIQPETVKLETNVPEITENCEIVEVEKIDNSVGISKAYLSRVDVSEDLTEPDLYDQCTTIMDLDKEALLSDEFDCKILFLEDGNRDSLFAATNDTVFQKAMLLYKKQREESDRKSTVEIAAEVAAVNKENDEPPIQKLETDANDSNKPVVDIKQEEEELESTNDEKTGGFGGCLADVAGVMVTELVEFGSVNLNRIHHHSPESTH